MSRSSETTSEPTSNCVYISRKLTVKYRRIVQKESNEKPEYIINLWLLFLEMTYSIIGLVLAQNKLVQLSNRKMFKLKGF